MATQDEKDHILEQAALWGDTDAAEEVRRVASQRKTEGSVEWDIPAPGATTWDDLMLKVIRGEIPFEEARKCRRMIIYAMTTYGKEVILHCIDIAGEFHRSDVRVDAALLAKLMTAAKIALDA
jgi:hypothetical protein